MMQQINCPKCGCRLAFDDSGLDQAFECCNCRHVFAGETASYNIHDTGDKPDSRHDRPLTLQAANFGLPSAVLVAIVAMGGILGAVVGSYVLMVIGSALAHSPTAPNEGIFWGGVCGFIVGVMPGCLLFIAIKALGASGATAASKVALE